MTNLSMFSWGYAGWGSSTKELKKLFADVERSRDYLPPLLVDIRLKRQGRALGFQQDKFERLVGSKNYRWLPALGNKALGQEDIRGELENPSAVEELLGLALARSKENQRVIFFCSCGVPKWDGGRCHRHLVVKELRRLAPKRGVSLKIEEWPGSYPQRRSLRISDEQAKQLLKSKEKQTYSAFNKRPKEDMLGMPWSSVVTFVSAYQSFNAIADPAILQGGKWKIRLPFGVDETPVRELMRFAMRSNKASGYIP